MFPSHDVSQSRCFPVTIRLTFGQRDEDFYQNGAISDEIASDKIEKRGLYTALMDFLDENKNWKVKEHFTNNNGLTIIERI